MSALGDIAAERRRQIEGEGHSPEDDAEYEFGELAAAAACYACPGAFAQILVAHHHEPTGSARYADDPSPMMRPVGETRVPSAWPWDGEHWKPDDRRRELVKAGALIAAEIDRLDRLEPAHLTGMYPLTGFPAPPIEDRVDAETVRGSDIPELLDRYWELAFASFPGAGKATQKVRLLLNIAFVRAPRIKRLEWQEPSQATNQTWLAKCPTGTYYVHIEGGRHQAWMDPEGGRDEWDGPDRGSLEEAQADAQAHFEAALRPYIGAP